MAFKKQHNNKVVISSSSIHGNIVSKGKIKIEKQENQIEKLQSTWECSSGGDRPK